MREKVDSLVLEDLRRLKVKCAFKLILVKGVNALIYPREDRYIHGSKGTYITC